MVESIQTDVLVIGGGGAAARAALEARLAGANVVLMTKGIFGAIGTRGAGATASGLSEFGVFATPGWIGPFSEAEKPYAKRFFLPIEEAFNNVIEVGLGMADPKLARILVEEAVASRTALLNWGARFGEYGIRSHGVPIMEALVGQIKRANVAVLERTAAVNLLVRDGECFGAVGIDETTGDIVTVKSGGTILGTGGDANLFMLNLNPPCNTGDGYAMAYEAGAELVNLEFKQVFLGSIYPNKNMVLFPTPPYTKLTNARGEQFLSEYLPKGASVDECLLQRNRHNPFSTQDPLSRYVDIAIVNEVREGRGTERFGVYLDRSDPRNPPYQLARKEFWQYRGIDLDGPVEVGVCHHCSLGGLRIDGDAETTLPHLYAAGEVAAGPHGADRMGGHMLLAAQVFGAKAGRSAAAYAAGRNLPDVDGRSCEELARSFRSAKGATHPAELKRRLQRSAYFNLLVVRSRDGLAEFLSDVESVNREFDTDVSVSGPQELVDAFELQNLLTLAKIEARVAQERTESRGPHYREDFPEQDDRNWMKSVTTRKVNGSLKVGTVVFSPDWRSGKKVYNWG